MTKPYACADDTYLLIGDDARCVAETDCPGFGRANICYPKEKCTDYWYEAWGSRACVDAYGCTGLWGYLYEVSGAKLCILESECYGSDYNGYLYSPGNGDYCFTAAQCNGAGLFTDDSDY